MIKELQDLAHVAINTFLHNPNQFASGGILLMAIGAVGAMLRKIPYQIWGWIVHQCTVTMSITDDQHAYYWMKAWMDSQRIMKRTRHMDVYNRGVYNYTMVPAPGHHWMLYKGRILSVQITRTEEKVLQKTQRSETISFTTFGRRQKIFRDMMEEIREASGQKQEKVPELHAWGSYSEWQQIHGYVPRPLDSVILPQADKDKLIKDIEHFHASRKWYGEMGIPYHKGYLFYGPPGTGKTSLVTGLSSYFKSNVYVLKLADMSDSTLREAVSGVEPNSFLVMEDIDTVNASNTREGEVEKDKEPKRGVTLSGLLNVIDGIFSPSGAVFVMTTNHKEKLDPALIRPGRVDMELHITFATPEQKQALYNRFFPGECPEKYISQVMTMAELQQALMEDKQIAEAK